ncbi:MAG: hypothetical protein Kow0089_21080 [Desulfobulbaceae bacterium]
MLKLPKHVASSGCRPKIDYPCSWQYRIIGESVSEMERIVAGLVHEEYTLTRSNVSRNGRYVSLSLELVVESEARRLELYRLLGAESQIKVVL